MISHLDVPISNNQVLSSQLDDAKPSPKRDPSAAMAQRYTVSIGALTLETSLASQLTDTDPEPVVSASLPY